MIDLGNNVPMTMRVKDAHGMGHFGTPRGNRKHMGTDFIVTEGQSLYAASDGVLVRWAYPDGNNLRKHGFLFKDTNGEFHKIFYASPELAKGQKNKRVKAGDKVATAQSVSALYKLPKMTDHIHYEHIIGKKHVDPMIMMAQKKSLVLI